MSSEMKTLAAQSGWTRIESIRMAVKNAGLPVPDAAYLSKAFTKTQWDDAARARDSLSEHFSNADFGDAAEFGPVLIPDPKRLDVRPGIDPALRAGQREVSQPDFVDPQLPTGIDLTEPSCPWTLLVAVSSAAGPSLGSHGDVMSASPKDFTVNNIDTRKLMTRQLWMALTLQRGEEMPDCNLRDKWTFTLFAAEDLVDGQSISGTVLHGVVRQRLGNPTRRIKSARIRPALSIGGARA